jgi:hypothetical protein
VIRSSARLGVVVASLCAALPLAVPPADAVAVVSAPLVSGLAGPLQLALGSDGTLYVGEDFAGQLTKVTKQGRRSVLVATDGAEVAGVDARGQGTLVWTTSAGASEESSATSSALMRALPNGRTSQVADLFQYEQQHNPDSINSYGFSGVSAECKASLPPFIPNGGDPYAGQLDTHPYSVVTVPGGWVVGDAAGNDLLKVGANGSVSTLAILPGQPVVISEEAAGELGLPECAVGATYTAEPVPTDVELGPDGMLYVSTLAGEPAPGSVYRVNPSTGAATRLATGLVGATNLAVAPDGTVYVAELFADRVSALVGGSAVEVASLPQPAALEWSNGKLYASQFALGGPDGGQVVTVTP